jgi:hypothetical protein
VVVLGACLPRGPGSRVVSGGLRFGRPLIGFVALSHEFSVIPVWRRTAFPFLVLPRGKRSRL